MTKFAKALGLIRTGRKLRKEAKGCKGFQSSQDRAKLGWDMTMQGYWLLGKLTNEGYAEYLKR